ncbi:hypothetical protein VTN96DRAFT_2739 [Rasamsonia emersonii]
MASEKSAETLPVWDDASSTGESALLVPVDIKRLLLEAVKEDGLSRTVLDRPTRGPSVLLVCPTTKSERSLTFDRAVEYLTEAFDNGENAFVDCTFEYIPETAERRVYLAVLAPCTAPDILHGNAIRKLVRQLAKFSAVHKKWTYALLALVAALLLTAATLFYSTRPDTRLIQYNVGDSIGPKYTALLTPENVTEWVEKHYDPEKWFIRIDDQALVPIELMDEQEWRYQEYLAKRYPEKAELRDSGMWYNLDFLSDPNNYMLPTDKEFHRGHCIRALRRYWQAKETGRHVCPWDIDYLHMRHCFSMLEELMFPPGPRAVNQSDVPLSLSWRTKVCMYEP